MNREAVYGALFNRVKDISGIVTASRRARLAKDVPPEEQPALFQEQQPETVINQALGLPPKFLLNVDLGIYVRVDDDPAPASLINPLVDAVCNALAPGPDEEDQTLGGLAIYCRITGKIDIVEGLLDGQGLALIPVEILAM